MNGEIRQVMAIVAGINFTPVLMEFLARLFPIRTILSLNDGYCPELKKRNNWLDIVGCGIFFAAIFGAVAFYKTVLEKNDPWGLGLGLSLGVLVPVLWCTVVTFYGIQREKVEYCLIGIDSFIS
ncbi:hypothetical protein MLD52_09840 [Puniceicoccaceae bacterium K14]|nr:hypothetical protein [Puniceicoccaceae bacterium K14]